MPRLTLRSSASASVSASASASFSSSSSSSFISSSSSFFSSSSSSSSSSSCSSSSSSSISSRPLTLERLPCRYLYDRVTYPFSVTPDKTVDLPTVFGALRDYFQVRSKENRKSRPCGTCTQNDFQIQSCTDSILFFFFTVTVVVPHFARDPTPPPPPPPPLPPPLFPPIIIQGHGVRPLSGPCGGALGRPSTIQRRQGGVRLSPRGAGPHE